MRAFVCLVLLPLVAWCAPAVVHHSEVTEDESLKPLIRTKRDEQIMFGNQQNTHQMVKKSNPLLNTNAAHVKSEALKEIKKLKENNQLEKDLKWEDGHNAITDKTESIDDEQNSGESEEDNDEGQKGYNYYGYKFPYNGNYRFKRNTKANELLTAEHMEPSSEENAIAPRAKRDLTTEEIARWLENGGQDPSEYYDYETPDYEKSSLDNLALNQLLDEYADVYQEENPVDYPEYNNYVETADPDNKELLSLLEYLVANESPKEANALPQIYPEDVKEEWEDIEEEQEEPQYEPVVYNGVPGVFIPMEQENVVSKRQYLSMVPGVRKRNDFYPYALEPEGGRWGAFVDQQEEKRNADEYERLLRMAQALNPPSEQYYEDFKKK